MGNHFIVHGQKLHFYFNVSKIISFFSYINSMWQNKKTLMTYFNHKRCHIIHVKIVLISMLT
jgi:hypothetical protein